MENKQISLQDEIRKIQRSPDIVSSDKPKLISELMRNFNKKPRQGPGQIPMASGPDTTLIQCKHYDRGCHMKCNTCNKFYPCRICHDENEDHKLDRFSVNTVQCKKCSQIQAPTKNCQNCGHLFGMYFCSVCNLWDNLDKEKFHCDKCGICRIGKRDDWVHCDRCNHCYRPDFEHKCIEDSTKTNCPICGEYIFDSPKQVSILKCGHAIHTKCLESLLKHDYRCPFCKKTVVDKIQEQWRVYDMLAPFEPIPEEFKNKRLVILCNDCEKKSDIKFSFEFLKCADCGGYNTSEVDMYDSINSGDNPSATDIIIP